MYIGVEIIRQLGQKDMLLQKKLAINDIATFNSGELCFVWGWGGDEKSALKVYS